MSRRAVVIPLIACVATAATGLAAVASSDTRDLAFTTSIRTVRVAATLDAGERACQRGIEREASFDAVELAYLHPPGRDQDLRIAVRDTFSRCVLARGTWRARSPGDPAGAVRVEPAVAAGSPMDVCVTNGGPARVALLGGRHYDAPSTAEVPAAGAGGGRNDIAVVFRRTTPKSALSQLPDVFRRAAVFRPLGSWFYWVLLAGLLVAVPALLWRALERAESDESPG